MHMNSASTLSIESHKRPSFHRGKKRLMTTSILGGIVRWGESSIKENKDKSIQRALTNFSWQCIGLCDRLESRGVLPTAWGGIHPLLLRSSLSGAGGHKRTLEKDIPNEILLIKKSWYRMIGGWLGFRWENWALWILPENKSTLPSWSSAGILGLHRSTGQLPSKG